jgi:hypothetical protein
VFERFTDRARQALALAQEESRLLGHDFIGTEHILLGLIREEDGIAAKALQRMGIALEDARAKVAEMIGLSDSTPPTGPPFTPRAKKVLELALREALQLGHNHIGTEHMLLGVVREGEGVGAQVLVNLGAGLAETRMTVLSMLNQAASAPDRPQDLPRRAPRVASDRGLVLRCSFCNQEPPATGRMIVGTNAFICEHCIEHWSESLSRAPAQKDTSREGRETMTLIHGSHPAGAQSVAAPADPDAARAEIEAAFVACATLSEDRQSVPSVEGGADLGPTLAQALEPSPFQHTVDVRIAVSSVEFIDTDHANVAFTVTIDGVRRFRNRQGTALVVDGAWKVARTTFCDLMRLADVDCPPEA